MRVGKVSSRSLHAEGVRHAAVTSNGYAFTHSVAAHDDSISIGSSSHLRPLHKKTTNHPVSRAVV